MSAVLIIATVACVVANTSVAIADYMRAPFVLENSAEVGLPPAALPYLATLKLAGAAGLVVGLLGVHGLGLAAGTGLTAFFVGAVLAHVRARVFHNIVFPGGYLLLAVAATGYFAGRP
ncbi:DoxX-like family protein [Streptomyces sp. LamerLS-316]|uniref:DoxX family protein n=1 Tax=unclassified Streptomyces TaxID=2593676 RepID=UPI000823B1AA|nr:MULTISPECIES: DoxX family protein [unclassified Streptomyces]MYQ41376.1 DoxX family protein [Streptomyces sp. SID4921]SCK09879.1 DoxX-like family protein [Streptomyces sp. LamerLS-316]